MSAEGAPGSQPHNGHAGRNRRGPRRKLPERDYAVRGVSQFKRPGSIIKSIFPFRSSNSERNVISSRRLLGETRPGSLVKRSVLNDEPNGG
jgi:hypothetical protein